MLMSGSLVTPRKSSLMCSRKLQWGWLCFVLLMGYKAAVQEAQSSSLMGNLRLGPERGKARSADRKNCELS